MIRPIVLATAVSAVATFSVASRVHAVCVDDGAHYIKRGYCENEAWPWPYVCPDRLAVWEPMCVMVNNGWRRQNLLGPHHFNENGTQLSPAGELRVRWIMTQVPPEHRNIFIERGLSADVTAQRVATVRAYATEIAAGGGAMPLITDTNLISDGRPAAIVDATNVKFQQTLPPPVIPAANGSGASSMSSSAGSSGGGGSGP